MCSHFQLGRTIRFIEYNDRLKSELSKPLAFMIPIQENTDSLKEHKTKAHSWNLLILIKIKLNTDLKEYNV